jgi:hypothetical protein
LQVLPEIGLLGNGSAVGTTIGAPFAFGNGLCSGTDTTRFPSSGGQALFSLVAPARTGSVFFSTCSSATNFDTMVSYWCAS